MPTDESEGLRIANWNQSGVGLFIGFGLMPIVLAFFTVIALTSGFKTKSGETAWAATYGGLAIVAIVTALLFYSAWNSAVLWMELGDQIVFRVPRGLRCLDWSDASSLRFEDDKGRYKQTSPDVPVPPRSHRILVMKLRNKKTLCARVTSAQVDVIWRLWQQHHA